VKADLQLYYQLLRIMEWEADDEMWNSCEMHKSSYENDLRARLYGEP
jgi:hypothetical protein